MRNIITIILLLISGVTFGQGTINFGASRPQDTSLSKGQLKLSAYANSNATRYLTVNSNGYVVFGVPAGGGGGSTDSTIFFTVYRGDTMRRNIYSNMYIDSVLFATNINSLDSALLIAFGAIADIYDTKADKDTLNNFVLKTYLDSTLNNYVDTSLLNDSLALKQNISDTTTWDATRYWVSTQIPSLAGYVPYTGATQGLNLGVHPLTAKDGVFNHSSGAGVTLSVTKGGSGEALTVNKTSGSGNAMSVTGGVTQLSELHTTTKIADAYIASALNWNDKYDATDTGRGTTNIVTGGSLNKVRDSLNSLINLKLNITDTANIRLRAVAGTNMSITGTYPNLTFSATSGGGGSPTTATNPQILYKSGTDTLKGATNATIDSTDGRLVLTGVTTTTNVTSASGGGVKIYPDIFLTNNTLAVNDTSEFVDYFQRGYGSNTFAMAMPSGTAAITAIGFYTSNLAVPTVTVNVPAQNSGVPLSNFTRALASTSTAANQRVLYRASNPVGASFMLVNNGRYTGGGRMVVKFGVPAYNSGHRHFFGLLASNSTPDVASSGSLGSVDPSGYTNIVGLGKDAADLTWQIMYNDASGTATKINTGLTPNSDYVYKLTISVPHRGNTMYVILEEMTDINTVNTYRYVLSSDLPVQGSRLTSVIFNNNLSTTAILNVSLINMTLEMN
jgi:hypothetical protein